MTENFKSKKQKRFRSSNPGKEFSTLGGASGSGTAKRETNRENFQFSKTRSRLTGETQAAQNLANETPEQVEFENGKNTFIEPPPANAVDNRSNELKSAKTEKQLKKYKQLLSSDRWLAKNGHFLTYIGILIFTLALYLRPHETFPSISVPQQLALVIAVITLVTYVPTQFALENSLTILTTEVKCLLFLFFWAFLTVPIAKSPGLAWSKLIDGEFVRVVLIFIVLVNTVRTKFRLSGLIWLTISVVTYYALQALINYQEGVFKTEGYRVKVDTGGMFGNPNDLALSIVIFTPLALVMGLAAKNILAKLFYFAAFALLIAGGIVTQSRGGFLGFLTVGAVLVWKLGRKNRIMTIAVSSIISLFVIAFAPGNYGLRILSIFFPALDPVGSASERTDLFWRSVEVTLRNPLGIGFGNFTIVGYRNLDTHNAYTQVSTELGWLAFVVYVILLFSPLKKLRAIEQNMLNRADFSWIYSLSIGLQACLIGYLVTSFFAPSAFNWYIYYPIAFAISLRRIYQSEHNQNSDETRLATI